MLKNFRLLVSISIICLLAFTQTVRAENDAKIDHIKLEKYKELEVTLEKAREMIGLLRAKNRELILDSNGSPSKVEVISRQNQEIIETLDANQAMRLHRERVLSWQLFSSYVILLVVVVISGFGVFLSYKEVKAGLDQAKDIGSKISSLESTSKQGDDTLKAGVSELIISANKIQITSAITGVVILVISIGFLYLFLDRVFKIDEATLKQVGIERAMDENSSGNDESEV